MRLAVFVLVSFGQSYSVIWIRPDGRNKITNINIDSSIPILIGSLISSRLQRISKLSSFPWISWRSKTFRSRLCYSGCHKFFFHLFFFLFFLFFYLKNTIKNRTVWVRNSKYDARKASECISPLFNRLCGKRLKREFFNYSRAGVSLVRFHRTITTNNQQQQQRLTCGRGWRVKPSSGSAYIKAYGALKASVPFSSSYTHSARNTHPRSIRIVTCPSVVAYYQSYCSSSYCTVAVPRDPSSR